MVHSGDGTISAMDIKNRKSMPFSQSEDQEDELHALLPIKGYFSSSTFQLGI
jgi:WD repeat-containing protein 55